MYKYRHTYAEVFRKTREKSSFVPSFIDTLVLQPQVTERSPAQMFSQEYAPIMTSVQPEQIVSFKLILAQ